MPDARLGPVLSAIGDLSFGQLLVGVIAASILSLIVFRHASAHGSKHPTAWGVATFLAAIPVMIVYFLHYRLTRRR